MLFAENGEKKLFAIVRHLQKYGIHPFRHLGLDPVERSGLYPAEGGTSSIFKTFCIPALAAMTGLAGIANLLFG